MVRAGAGEERRPWPPSAPAWAAANPPASREIRQDRWALWQPENQATGSLCRLPLSVEAGLGGAQEGAWQMGGPAPPPGQGSVGSAF